MAQCARPAYADDLDTQPGHSNGTGIMTLYGNGRGGLEGVLLIHTSPDHVFEGKSNALRVKHATQRFRSESVR